VRRLVVNADDLGLTAAVNDGIFDAHQHGILTSASLFAGAPATADAIRRARAHPSLGLGAHLTLVDGTPTLPPTHIPTLVRSDRRFPPSWKRFLAACLRGRVSMVEVERELTAQIESLLEAGVRLTHLDTHKHVHVYPPLFAVVARLACRFDVPAVRVPYERWSHRALPSDANSGARRTIRRQGLLNLATWPWARRDLRIASSLGLRTPPLIGRIHTGVLDQVSLHALLRAIGPDVTELMVHPGYRDAELTRTATRLLDSRHEELALLCSPETRALVAQERIHLVRHDLMHMIRRSRRHVS
jgi:predicted glycoside hydrolase/deacetylase ChbG (UPF0249 family)